MAFLITGIFTIDPALMEFTENEDGSGEVFHPSRAYEVLVEIDGKKFETDGVVWNMEGQETVCFISEEFEDFLESSYADQFTDEHRRALSNLIYDKFTDKDIELPFCIWE